MTYKEALTRLRRIRAVVYQMCTDDFCSDAEAMDIAIRLVGCQIEKEEMKMKTYKFIKNGTVVMTVRALTEYHAAAIAEQRGLKEGAYNVQSPDDKGLRKDASVYVRGESNED